MGRHALIIAGGSGTRFWPASRKAFPKQFLKFGTRSLLQATADRVTLPVWVVCGRAHERLVREHLPHAKIVVEPAAKNTAPAIALATKAIMAEDPDAHIAALPADQHITDISAFQRALDQAFSMNALVTIGVKPTRPETGFGYILRNGDDVERFVEKPSLETAKQFVADGNYLWNGGIFVYPAKLMQRLFETHAPDVWASFETSPSISIDYAIAEKAKGLKVVTLDAGWSDVGSWDALGEVRPADSDGNIGDVIAVDARANTTQTTKPVALLGVSDLIVVETADAILVCKRGEAQRLREVIATLEKKRPDLL